MFHALFNLHKEKECQDFKVQKTFLLMAYFTTILSFVFISQASSNLQMRILNSAYMPLSFFLPSYLKNKRETKPGKIFIYSLMLYYVAFLIRALVYGFR